MVQDRLTKLLLGAGLFLMLSGTTTALVVAAVHYAFQFSVLGLSLLVIGVLLSAASSGVTWLRLVGRSQRTGLRSALLAVAILFLTGIYWLCVTVSAFLLGIPSFEVLAYGIGLAVLAPAVFVVIVSIGMSKLKNVHAD